MQKSEEGFRLFHPSAFIPHPLIPFHRAGWTEQTIDKGHETHYNCVSFAEKVLDESRPTERPEIKSPIDQDGTRSDSLTHVV